MVIRNSAGAIVGYFVFTLVLPTLSGLLAANAAWFRDAQALGRLQLRPGRPVQRRHGREGLGPHRATAGIWLVVPLAIGLRLLLRSEVK